MAQRNSNPHTFLTAEEAAHIESVIHEVESQTSAQIKVVLARHSWLGLRRKARILFERFGLNRTAQRNCVLVLLITSDRQFLVYGDRAIHHCVGTEFWRSVRDGSLPFLRTGTNPAES